MPAHIARLSTRSDFVQESPYLVQEDIYNLEVGEIMTTFAATKNKVI